mgnify:FL=1
MELFTILLVIGVFSPQLLVLAVLATGIWMLVKRFIG